MNIILEAKNLSYSYDGHKALDNVSFSVKKGSATALLGRNGAGKSTLFLNLNGVLKPQSGEIYFKGEKVNYSAKGIKTLKHHVGIVFQDPNDQLFSVDVRSDIAFGLLNIGYSDKEANEEVEKIAEYTGISQLLNRPVHALSYGQKKRVAIAGVIVMKPEVIILDEPTAGLDPEGVSSILKLLTSVRKDLGSSVVISTHDIDIIPLYCDYGYILNNGKVMLSGTTEELFKEKEIVRKCGLRLPRISHLMEILHDKDNLNVDLNAATIAQARKTINNLVKTI